MLNNIGVANKSSTINSIPYNPNNDKIRNKLIECITLIMQAKEDLFIVSDKNVVLANFNKDLNQYSKYLSLEHLETLYSINQQARDAMDSFENFPINELMANEKYKSFAKLYSGTIDKYGKELTNSYNKQNNDSSGYRDLVGLPLLVIIMNCALDMLAINLMSSNSYVNSVKIYERISNSIALLQAMTQKMADFYSKLANKRQEILSSIKNKKGPYYDKYKDRINDFVDPGNTVSMDDKDFKILCDECGYPCNQTDSLISAFKDLLNNNSNILMALKKQFCNDGDPEKRVIEIIVGKFSDYLNKNGSNQIPKDVIKAFLTDYCGLYNISNLDEICNNFAQNVQKYGPNIELKTGQFPEGAADFFKVERDKDGKVIKCIINSISLNAMVRFISQQLTLVLPDSSTNAFGFIYDTYGDGLKDQAIITNMLPAIGTKSKQVQDASSGLTNQINLCQQNVQVVANFFDKICEIFKELSSK